MWLFTRPGRRPWGSAPHPGVKGTETLSKEGLSRGAQTQALEAQSGTPTKKPSKCSTYTSVVRINVHFLCQCVLMDFKAMHTDVFKSFFTDCLSVMNKLPMCLSWVCAIQLKWHFFRLNCVALWSTFKSLKSSLRMISWVLLNSLGSKIKSLAAWTF